MAERGRANSALLTEGWLYKLSDKVAEKKGLVEDKGSWKRYYFFLKRLPTCVSVELHKKRPGLATENPDKVLSLSLYTVFKRQLSQNVSSDQRSVCEVHVHNTVHREYLAFFTDNHRDKFVFYLMTHKQLSINPDGLTCPVTPTNSVSNQRLCAFGSDCLLQVFSKGITLALRSSRAVLAQWPLNCVRWYDYDETTFKFQAGRRSPMGEGLYSFQALVDEGKKLYSFLDSVVMKETEKKAFMAKHKMNPSDIENSTVQESQCYFSQIASLPPEIQHVTDLRRVSKLNFGPDDEEYDDNGTDELDAQPLTNGAKVLEGRNRSSSGKSRCGSTNSGGLYVDMKGLMAPTHSSPINCSRDQMRSYPTHRALQDSSRLSGGNSVLAGHAQGGLSYPDSLDELQRARSISQRSAAGVFPLPSPISSKDVITPVGLSMTSPDDRSAAGLGPRLSSSRDTAGVVYPSGDSSPPPVLPPMRTRLSFPSDNPLYKTSVDIEHAPDPTSPMYENQLEMSGDFTFLGKAATGARCLPPLLSYAEAIEMPSFIPTKHGNGGATGGGPVIGDHLAEPSVSGSKSDKIAKSGSYAEPGHSMSLPTRSTGKRAMVGNPSPVVEKTIESSYLYTTAFDPSQRLNKQHSVTSGTSSSDPSIGRVPPAGTYEEVDPQLPEPDLPSAADLQLPEPDLRSAANQTVSPDYYSHAIDLEAMHKSAKPEYYSHAIDLEAMHKSAKPEYYSHAIDLEAMHKSAKPEYYSQAIDLEALDKSSALVPVYYSHPIAHEALDKSATSIYYSHPTSLDLSGIPVPAPTVQQDSAYLEPSPSSALTSPIRNPGGEILLPLSRRVTSPALVTRGADGGKDSPSARGGFTKRIAALFGRTPTKKEKPEQHPAEPDTQADFNKQASPSREDVKQASPAREGVSKDIRKTQKTQVFVKARSVDTPPDSNATNRMRGRKLPDRPSGEQ